jgi:phosphoribosyl 1,2-cyclic phosphodiesterase
MGFGGNTACVEVRHNDDPPIVIDGGTGIRQLGQKLAGEQARRVDVFLTHFHYDHIQGIPFFAPLYNPGVQVHFHAAVPSARLEELLNSQVRSPYFPVRMPRAENYYHEITPEGVQLGKVHVAPIPLRHPDPVTGYRIKTPGGTIVYGSDHEHGLAEFDDGLVRMSKDADFLIYDAHFTPEEYPRFAGWGHSTWLDATKVALAAGARHLALFHHAPDHDDAFMRDVVRQARKYFKKTDAAREGWTVRINRRRA